MRGFHLLFLALIGLALFVAAVQIPGNQLFMSFLGGALMAFGLVAYAHRR